MYTTIHPLQKEMVSSHFKKYYGYQTIATICFYQFKGDKIASFQKIISMVAAFDLP